MGDSNIAYMSNPNLKRAGAKIEFTGDQIEEYVKCSNDPVYFALNYMKIVNVDEGLVPFKMWDFQKNMLETFYDNRFVICKMPRQVGKCVDTNTIVKIKDTITNEIFDVTIGDFYELVRKESIKNTRRTDRETESDIFEQNRKHRLRSMSVLCNEVERFDFTHNEYSQNKAKRVCEETSVEVSDISKLSEITNRKFIESYEITRYSVFTDTGFEEIESLHKTIPYEKWKIVLNSGETLFCADDHILFDENFEEIYVKNCIPNITQIQTVNGVSLVKECVNLQIKENMFDLSLNSINKRFYTNNILSHNSTTIIAYLLHQILFRDNTSVAMLANKGSTARELLGRLQLAYENLPIWLQQGINVWNKGNIELENGSKVLAAATSSSAVRGGSYKILFLDEYAFVPNNQADQFFNSVYPTISSGKTSQVLIVSTPNGLNHFYRMWSNAENKKSNYVPLEVHWSAVPGRDEKWKEETVRNTSLEQFKVEFETEFLGSAHTLISGAKLKTLVFNDPIRIENNLHIIEEPQKGHTYVITVDVARGQNLDYSAFSVFDVTNIPYKQVAKYRDKEISPLLYPTIVFNAATAYNNAYVLVEINDIGQQVSDILHHELEYENLVKIAIKPRQGQQMSYGHTKKIQFGVKTSVVTKRIGCSNLKTLIESDKLQILDSDTIMELMTFVATRESFAAEEGSHDDLAMTLVLFAWFIAQRNFRESLNGDIRTVLQKEQLNILQDDIVPFGIIDDGINDRNMEIEEIERQWVEERKLKAPLDSYEYDWRSRL